LVKKLHREDNFYTRVHGLKKTAIKTQIYAKAGMG